MTEPSGARFPLSTTSPPVGLSGALSLRTTSCPGASFAAAASSAIVRPVTVGHSPCRNLPSSMRFATSGVPPARYRSVATNRPPGLRSARIGTRELMRSKSSIERGIFASLAMASRCSTEFVEPPVAATPAIAFSIADFVRILDAVTFLRRRSITSSPDRRPAAAFAGSVAGTLESPIGAMPRNSETSAIVLAVNCPPQAPAPGQAEVSSILSRASLMLPRACAPIAS